MYTKIYKNKLNQLLQDDRQKIAFLSSKPTVVLAGPGSGKTAVLTLKAAKIITEINGPRGAACITYSQEAAFEMKQRINSYGIVDERRLFVGTIHHFCISDILNPYAKTFKVELLYPLTIASKKERQMAFTKARDTIEAGEEVNELEMNVERRNKAGSLSSIVPPTYDLALKVAIEYERELHSIGVIDFEDIINYSVKLIQEQEYVRKALTAKYQWIFVDEYQDLGKPLHEIVLSLFHNTKIKLYIVGDPDQSIYSFNGANPNYMHELLDLAGFFIVQLKNNYRSPQAIVDASVLVLDKDRVYTGIAEKTAEFKFHECDDDWCDQFEFLASKIIKECDDEGIAREEVGVLIKGHKEIALCKQILEKHGIDCYISKRTFDRTTLINWFEKCAQWLQNNASMPMADLFYEWCSKFNLDKFYDIQDRSSIIKFAHKLRSCNKDTLINWIIDMLKLFKVENNISDDEKENLENFKEAIISDEFRSYTLSMFSKIGKPINQVVLLTWFAAKGLEFDAVVLTGMDEKMMPNYSALQNEEKMLEQRRMCFVGVSRSKRKCYLTRSNQYTIYSSKYHKYYTHDYKPSRFWNELKKIYENI